MHAIPCGKAYEITRHLSVIPVTFQIAPTPAADDVSAQLASLVVSPGRRLRIGLQQSLKTEHCPPLF